LSELEILVLAMEYIKGLESVLDKNEEMKEWICGIVRSEGSYVSEFLGQELRLLYFAHSPSKRRARLRCAYLDEQFWEL
jgi:hypothetical protein